jgi:hypothetical protein
VNRRVRLAFGEEGPVRVVGKRLQRVEQLAIDFGVQAIVRDEKDSCSSGSSGARLPRAGCAVML